MTKLRMPKIPTITALPRPPRVDWHTRQAHDLGLGDRAADKLRNGMGSWGFVFTFIAIMSVWALLNTVTKGWDPYPFILLNLFLSMLAGLQGAILLIAAKRQDAVAAALAKSDFDTVTANQASLESLQELQRAQLVVLEDLQVRMARLESRTGGKPGEPGNH